MSLRALQGPTGGGAPVGGTGTSSPSTIPRWTGASTLGDSIIVQNAGGTAIAIGDAAGVSYVGLVQVKRAGGAGWLTLDHTGGSYAEVQSYNVPLYLNRQGNNTILNATSGNVGIGTASPGAILHTLGTGTSTGIFATSSANAWMELRRSTSTTLGYIGTGSGLVTGGAAADLAFRCESGNLLFSTVATERARIDSAGRWYVGVSAVVAPASGGIWAIINQPGAAGGQEWHNSSASPGGAAIIPTQNRATWYVYQNAVGSEAYSQSCVFTPTGIDLTGASATHGLKLPATPGSVDAQTLDCYAETTLNSGFTTSGITSTGTFTVTARATRIGRSIALTVKITPSGGASLTFASGWYVTLTGIPQMPDIAAFAAISNDAIGARGSIFCDAAATPTIYGGTAGAYALGTNISLLVSGIVT